MEIFTKSELEHCLEHFCKLRRQFEYRSAQYDIQESLTAVRLFTDIAKKIHFSGDIVRYAKILEAETKDYQANYPTHLKGEYNAGPATMGSCLADFMQVLEKFPNKGAAIDYLNTKFRACNHKQIKENESVYTKKKMLVQQQSLINHQAGRRR